MRVYGLLQDQVEHYGTNYNVFSLDERINDRSEDFLHRLKLQSEHEDVDASALNKLTRVQRAELEHFIKSIS